MNWTEYKEVSTRLGIRKLRTAPADQEFWTNWKADKDKLKAQGIGVSKKANGDWEVCQWQGLNTEDIETKKQLIEESKTSETDFMPKIKAPYQYFNYQKAGVKFILDRGNTLLGDDMGLGKTLQSIGYINETHPDKVLIIVPASLKINWKLELNKFCIYDYTICIVNSGDDLPNTQNTITIINYDILSKYENSLKSISYDLAILDEAHKIKNPKTKRTKAANIIKAARKIAATGTPISNRPSELFTILNWLDKKTWSNFFFYAKRYCAGKQTRFGFDASGASNLEELQMRLRETLMIRRLKADVLKELPPKTRELIVLEQIPETARLIQKEREAAAELYDLSELSGIQAAFSEMSRIRHDMALASASQMLEVIKDQLEDNPHKICIFAHHTDLIKIVADGLKEYGVVTVTGQTNIQARQDAVNSFQNDPNTLVFIGNILAAGVGLTLTAGSHTIFLELDWVPSNISQAEDRQHRIGQKQNVLVQHFVINGSMNVTMAEKIIEKQNIIDKALDNDIDKAIEALKGFDPVKEILHLDTKTVNTENYSEENEKNVKAFTIDEKRDLKQKIRIIAGMDSDHAHGLNGVGFNKIDTFIGHKLAGIEYDYTDRQAHVVSKLVNKYRNQLL